MKKILLFLPLLLSGCAVLEKLQGKEETVKQIGEGIAGLAPAVAAFNPQVALAVGIAGGLIVVLAKLFT